MINIKKKTNITLFLWIIALIILFVVYCQNSYTVTFVISNNLSVYEFWAILFTLLGFFFWVYRYFDLEEVRKEKEEHFKYLRTLQERLSPDKLKVKLYDDIEYAKSLYEKEWELYKAPLGYKLTLDSENLYDFHYEILHNINPELDIEIDIDNFEEIYKWDNVKKSLAETRYEEYSQIDIEPIDVEWFWKNKSNNVLKKEDTVKILNNLLEQKEVYIIDKWIYYFITD